MTRLLSALALFSSFGCTPQAEGPFPVGPEGATLAFGSATLTIPPGAVDSPTDFVVRQTDQPVPVGFDGLSVVWIVEPPDVTPSVPLVLELPFSPQGAAAEMFAIEEPEPRVLDSWTEPGRIHARIDATGEVFVARPRLETFETDDLQQPADVLVVLDTSCSMFEEQDDVSSGISAYATSLQSRRVDFHIALTTMDMESPTGFGQLQFYGEDNVIEPSPDAGSNLQWLGTQGTDGAEEERARDAVTSFLDNRDDVRNNGFYRDDASFTLVFVTDGEDGSTGDRLTFQDRLHTLKPESTDVRAHLMGFLPGQPCSSGADPSGEFLRYVDWTGGRSADICAFDLAPGFTHLAEALEPAWRVTIDAPVARIESVVSVTEQDERTLAPSEYRWLPSENTLRFDQAWAPPPDSTIRVQYLPD